MGKKKTRRTLEQRLEIKLAEAAELKAKMKQKSLTNALDEGLVSKENEKEFKKLQNAVTALTKAAKIAGEYNNEALQDSAEKLRDNIAEAMRNLIDDESGDDDSDDDDDDEYEEDNG